MSDLLYLFFMFLQNQVCLFVLFKANKRGVGGKCERLVAVWLRVLLRQAARGEAGESLSALRVTQMPSDADVSWAGTAEEPRHSGTFRACMRVAIVSRRQRWPRARQHGAVHLPWCCFFMILIPGQRRNLDQVSTTTFASGEAKYLTAFLCWNFAWKSPFFLVYSCCDEP